MAHFFEIEVNPALQRLSLKIWDGPKLIVDWFTTDNGGLMGGRVGMYSHSQVMMMKMLGMTMIIWVGIGYVLPSAGPHLLFSGPQLLDKPENREPSSSFLERGWSGLSQRETVFNNRYNTENKGDPLFNNMFVL